MQFLFAHHAFGLLFAAFGQRFAPAGDFGHQQVCRAVAEARPSTEAVDIVALLLHHIDVLPDNQVRQRFEQQAYQAVQTAEFVADDGVDFGGGFIKRCAGRGNDVVFAV